MAAVIDTNASAGSVVVMEKTDKRDYLVNIEHEVQKDWQEGQFFDADPPPLPEGVSSYAEFFETNQSMQKLQEQYPKWFGTFPYAYMNGSFHLGHAFTISKVEFAAGFERMRGKRVLFPVGYHATGMPIKASCDKLIREMELFGENFERYSEEDSQTTEPAVPTPTPAKALEAVDPSKAKKGKLNAKSTGLTYQFQILELIGVPRAEIKKFAEPAYWLTYFPPIAKTDLNAIGARVDWRRQFVTTDANPYYDSFVRWQMNLLREQGRIKFGERYTIYSPKDDQPCMDHDRQSGEAVGPQEYTAVKMKVLQWGPNAPSDLLQAVGGKTVYMVAATLRPETMYGQTNCFVGPTLKYGVFEASDTEVFLVTSRSARNMSYQGIFERPRGQCAALAEFKGADILGTKVAPPFGIAKEVYVLPMDGVLATKGTGVVTSVPSDSPDDYRTYMDLRKKPEHYKILPEWAAIDPIPVITTPKYGEMCAVTLCEQFKIQSQKDVKQLAEAKDLAYKEGFYNGIMSIGEFKGQTVEQAKPQVRRQMIDAGLAVAYAEPESEVVSRSADVCVVALVDQWYLDYGEKEWKAIAQKLLARMNTYLPETRNGFEAVLDWLNQWACARSYGLGSKLPWDPAFLVESLSDSTIYMSYYTVANLLHNDMFGSEAGTLGIRPEDMTDEIWSYVLTSAAYPSGSSLSLEKASQLKYHFQYFYPMDLRSSGKDLINNHLTFCIYIHAAIFPEKHWPQAIRTNGHLMLNGKKMSKSTGNFLTMREATKKYGADAMRLSLADAGDEITDANFEETVANAAILRLHTAALWAEEMKAARSTLRTGELNDFDLGFQAEMDNHIALAYANFEKMEYKEALKRGLYDFEIARNWYRSVTSPDNGGPGLHGDLVFAWIRNNALLIAPFTPHFSEHVWKNILEETSSVQKASFPRPSQSVDPIKLQEIEYMRGVVDSMRSAEAVLSKRKGKAAKSGPVFEPSKPKSARVYVATEFPAWQTKGVELVREAWNEQEGTIDDAKLRQALDAAGLSKDKKAMPFCQSFKVLSIGAPAFARSLPFSELDVLQLLAPYIRSSLKYVECDIISTKDALQYVDQNGESSSWSKERIESSEPGTPSIQFWNI